MRDPRQFPAATRELLLGSRPYITGMLRLSLDGVPECERRPVTLSSNSPAELKLLSLYSDRDIDRLASASGISTG